MPDDLLGGVKVVASFDLTKGPANLNIGGQTLSISADSFMRAVNRPKKPGQPTKTDYPANIVKILTNWGVKDKAGNFKVKDPEVLAAKKWLAEKMGLKKYLKADGSNLKIKEIDGGNGTALADDGTYYGTFYNKSGGATAPFNLNIYTEPTFSPEDLVKMKERIEG